MIINIEYDEELKELFIARKCSSDCIYLNVERKDIGEYVKEYVNNLYVVED